MATGAQIRMLLADPEHVLRIIGLHMVAAARRAFRDQRAPGSGEPWPERYPNQSDAYLNVAGAIQDLASGGDIKPRRYDRRPAGVDTGELRNRITFEVSGSELRVGSAVPYARRFQEGGQSTILLGGALERSLLRVIDRSRRASRSEGQRPVEEIRLGPVLRAIRRGERVWVTTSPARPFIGLSQDDAADLASSLREAAEGESDANTS